MKGSKDNYKKMSVTIISSSNKYSNVSGASRVTKLMHQMFWDSRRRPSGADLILLLHIQHFPLQVVFCEKENNNMNNVKSPRNAPWGHGTALMVVVSPEAHFVLNTLVFVHLKIWTPVIVGLSYCFISRNRWNIM